MKSRNKKISLVAHITVRGLESLERGRIDLKDPRLDGESGTVQMELHGDRKTTKQMLYEANAAKELIGDEGALYYIDETYIRPWRVKVALITTGDSERDELIVRYGESEGHEVMVATAGN
jgi:hypothetical protein